jgi:hypothetical protein
MPLANYSEMTPVYCALIEILPLDGCEFDPSDVAGAAVRCYIPADDAERAIEFLQSELGEMKMKLIETEWCVDYDNTEWENPDNETEDEYVSEARETSGIVFDTFYTWGHDAPDVA